MAFWFNAGITAASAAVFVYLLFVMPTRWLKIETVDLPLGLGKTILQISDLHVDMLRITPEKLVTVIRETNPDYIFMTGDYTYRQSYLPRLARYLEVIVSTGVPVYAVLGNHDYELPRLKSLLTLFQRYGIIVLRNDRLEFPDFQLVGIDDYSSGHSRPSKAFRHVTDGKPVLVMTHDPNVVLQLRKPYHYLMAGHLHGKQFNVPGLFDIKPKGPLPAKGIYKGLHRRGGESWLYISKGIGQAGINARFLVRSEVTVHKL